MMRRREMFVVVSCIFALTVFVGTSGEAADLDEAASAGIWVVNPGSFNSPEVFPALDNMLVVGTSQNSSDPTATLNDMFAIDVLTDTSVSGYSGMGLWGATADLANDRILFTRSSGAGNGDQLAAIPFAGGDPVLVGNITDVAGAPQRIDGLAISGGVLYGTVADAVSNGLFIIDLGTFVATQVGTYSDSVSGIDADPDTGVIYGVNDTSAQLVTISTTGVITNVAAYPSGLSDIDGIAVGGGKAYLVTDESGDIPVYDIASGLFETPLTSPFTGADVFSGAAFGPTQQPTPTPTVPPDAIPTVSTYGLFILIGLIAMAALFILVRR